MPTRERKGERGFTIVELMIAAMIVGVLMAVAVPAYLRYVERARVAQATQDIGAISVILTQYRLDNDSLPGSLAEIKQERNDPWGRPYQYYNLLTAKGNGQARKDKKLSPLNSDFDLYSMGKDGASQGPLNAKVSRDDIVRARDGKYIGPAEDFDP